MANDDEPIVNDESDDEVLDFTYSITSYGADYPVDSIVNRLRDDKIQIPRFQRGYVWNEQVASRFVESLLLGLPVPGVFFSRDAESANLLVIDGQQRLRSLLFFYDGMIGDRVFRLKNVQQRFEGKTYKQLDSDDRQRLDDSIIHATVVKQDEPSEDNSSIYLIFERLNTGGMQLQPQEIRTAIYPGPFSDFLAELNQDLVWRSVYGNVSKRMKDQEFILRFFAMLLYRDQYTKPLKGFLNRYMAANRELGINSREELQPIFKSTVQCVSESLGKKAFRPKRAINASIYDSVMVGIASRLFASDSQPAYRAIASSYDQLLSDPEYVTATSEATSDEAVVEKRMETRDIYLCGYLINMLDMRLDQLTKRVDTAFAVAENAADEEVQAHLSRYLCVLTSGYLEECLRLVITAYAESAAAPNVSAYVASKVKTVTNINEEKLGQLLNSFSNEWMTSLQLSMNFAEKDALDSLIANRNNIAHGQHVGVSYVRVKEWYGYIKAIVHKIRAITNV